MSNHLRLRGIVFISILTGFYLVPELGGRLLLTEIYYDTPGRDAEQEWVELANLGPEAVDLSDYKLSDEESSGGREGAWRFPDGSMIGPDQVIVVAQQATGFHQLFGFNPAYEISDTDPTVPDMRPYRLWAWGDMALANEGDEVLLLDDRNVIRDAVNYGDASTFFAPSVHGVLTGQSIERMPAGCDSDTAADWLPQSWPTPGQLSNEGECRVPQNPAELAPLSPIGQIQGKSDVSPYVNQIVNFRGVVTGSYEDRNTRGSIFYTLFVQDLPGYEDGDPATSDGIAVFLGRRKPAFAPGDQVNVTGLVTEYFGFTEIDDDQLTLHREAGDVELPVPVMLELPNAGRSSYLESLEGMLVALDGFVQVAGPTHVGCGFEVTLDEPGLERVLRQRAEDPADQLIPVLHDSDVHCDEFLQVKRGDLVNGIAGPLTYSFDQFRIVQQRINSLELDPGPWPDLLPAASSGQQQFSVATFNLGSHFDVNFDTGADAEPVPSAAEVTAKHQKLVYAIHETLGCPTIIGIQEVENAGLIRALASDASVACGFAYEVSHRESPDARGIDLALLTDSRLVEVQDVRLRQTCTRLDTGITDESIRCAPDEAPLFSRPPLQVSLRINDQPYIFLVNHFKSKRGGEAETEPQRLEQARYVNELVAGYRSEGDDIGIVVLGDFNDYELSPTMQIMTGAEGRLINPLERVPFMERYSYVFGGVYQLLDGILLSSQLTDDIRQAMILHVNADYPEGMTLDVTAEALPYRSSDHDLPLIVLAQKTDEMPPIQPTATPTEAVAAAGEGNRLAVTTGALVTLAMAAAAGLILAIRRSHTSGLAKRGFDRANWRK